MNNHSISSSDDQFYSWPLRIKKNTRSLLITPLSYENIFKNHIMSLDIIPDLSGNGNCILSSFESIGLNGNKIKMLDAQDAVTSKHTLDSLLESLPLVYNPSTKQLQVVKLKSRNNETNSNSICKSKTQSTCKCSEEECCELIPKSKNVNEDFCKYTTDDLKHNSLNLTESSHCRPIVPHSQNRCLNNQKSEKHIIVSSTLLKGVNSSPSFESVCSSISSSTPETSLSSPALSPRLNLDVSNKEPSKKKKGITEFFTRNLFPWRSKNGGKVSFSQSECDADSMSSDVSSHDDTSTSTTWRIFSKGDGVASHSSEILTHEVPAGTAGLIMEERPGNLPAKTAFEQERHKQEYKSIVSAARKKELKELKEKRKAQALQLKQEKHLSDSVNTWNSLIIPKWDTMYSQKKCQELWWSGLPSCVRGKVWKLAIGNELNITSEQYSNLVQRSLDKLSSLDVNKSFDSDCRDPAEVSKNQESTLKLIQLDVSRTFPHLCIFQNGGPFHDPLHNILGAYVCYRPDVGYVQGMSFLAATLLLNMEESEAFIFFANLINRPPHMSFYTVDQRVMHAYFSTFEEVLHENLPELADHLKNLKVLPNMYFLDWVLTVFSRSFPLDVAARIWDIFLRDGEEFFFRAGIGIMKHFEKEILAEDCTAHVAQFLTRLPEDLNCEAFFKDLASIPVVTSGKATFMEVLRENLNKS